MWCKSLVLFSALALLPLWAAAETPDYFPGRNSRGPPPRRTCPRACNEAGNEPEGWTAYHDLGSLAVCPEPVMLLYNLHMPLEDPNTLISIRACTLDNASTQLNYLTHAGNVSRDTKGASNPGPHGPLRSSLNETAGIEGTICGTDSPRKARVTSHLVSWEGNDSPSMQRMATDVNNDVASNVLIAINALSDHVQQDDTCDKKIVSVYVRGTLIGLYSGALIDKIKTSPYQMQRLASKMEGTSRSIRKAVEICGPDRSSSSTFGVVADASGDFAAVQKALRAWSDGECISDATATSARSLEEADIWFYDLAIPNEPNLSGHLHRRQSRECRNIRVEQNDNCEKLASRCGIGGFAFENFNKDTPNLCSSLQPGQAVCCSSGSLPDVGPSPQEDGTCAVHSVEMDEGCKAIAVRYGIDESDLRDFNKKTWGWDGCGNLLFTQKICVSKGDPPMPATFEDSQCGPTKPGSTRPTDGTELADMNPCPLNVCCNIWGNCGTTSEFCTISNTTTGNPGTSKQGENGCQSSCGTEIVNNGRAPDVFRKIGYFEAWNFNRPCLHMNVLDVDESYTHVHFAFGELSPDMHVVIPDDQKTQWNHFIRAQNYKPKKILAFGGWAFSNEGPTANLLRESVMPHNRDLFSDRVVKFAIDNNLDGLDFDWEYPGATDIDGSPPGQEEDGENYYQFLRLVRRKLPSRMSLSIATPASYWYLRAFPIEKMMEVLDYIVYMTYDFHGQWDVSNEWAQPGCPSGNCLRSHVNGTITWDSLVMITKAGAPAHKVVVGVSSYGRSFKMSDGSCRGEMCTYLGGRNDSPAKRGRCTRTGGYISNFEIEEIIERGGAIKTWHDGPTNSDYLQYDGVEWVAYMNDRTKASRSLLYEAWNFGGTSDWAVDLQGEGERGEYDIEDSDYIPNPDWDRPLAPCPYDPDDMQAIFNLDYASEVPQHCAHKYLFSVLHKMYKEIKDRFDELLRGDYDKYYDIFAKWINENKHENLHDLMITQGNNYFDCEIWSDFPCCTGCEANGFHNCRNCIDDCNIHHDHHPGKEWRLKEMPCPPDYSKRGSNRDDYDMETIYWSYKNNTAKDAFLGEIFAVVGVGEDFIEHPKSQRILNHDGALCEGSFPGEEFPTFEGSSETCQRRTWWLDAPSIKTGFGKSDVFNPKDAVRETLNGLELDDALSEFELELLADEYDGNSVDLVDALIVPMALMWDSLEHMDKVVEAAKDIDEANTVTLVVDILSTILLFVGGFGGVAAGASAAGLRHLGLAMVAGAEVGNTALGLYTAISEPRSAPLLIFNLVMSVNNIRDASKVSEAARRKIELGPSGIAKMSTTAATLSRQATAVNKPPPRVPLCRYA